MYISARLEAASGYGDSEWSVYAAAVLIPPPPRSAAIANRPAFNLKLSTRRAEIAERKAAAFELRKRGCSYATIQRQLGYATGTQVRRDIEETIRELLTEPAKEVLSLELERLDAMLEAVWDRVLDGDEKAVAAALRILDRRSRYLGLDAQAGPGDVSEVQAWLVSMGTKPAPQIVSQPDDDDDVL